MKETLRIICTKTSDETLAITHMLDRRNIMYVEETGVFYHRFIRFKCTKKQFKSIFKTLNYNKKEIYYERKEH